MRGNSKYIFLLASFAALLVALWGAGGLSAHTATTLNAAQAVPPAAGPHSTTKPVVGHPVAADVSAPLRNTTPKQVKPETQANEKESLNALDAKSHRVFNDKISASPDAIAAGELPGALLNFEGTDNTGVFRPPDTIGEVGRNHYVQMTNSGFKIFNKQGNLLYGPAATNTLFSGFGGACEANDSGDPIVIYDQFADRWILTEFAVPGPPDGYFECIAISTSPDPLGTYYRYGYLLSPTTFNDYPKLSVWSDAYYMTMNQFANGGNFSGAGVYAFNRNAMLAGDPDPAYIYIEVPNDGTLTPADIDGFTMPPADSPGMMMSIYNTTATDGYLGLYRFYANFDAPFASDLVGPQLVRTQPFDFTICSDDPFGRDGCIVQPNTTARPEVLEAHPYNRLVYRNFGGHDSLLVTHAEDLANAPADQQGTAGMYWAEIRNMDVPTMTAVYQEGRSPNDGNNRWMGSIAFDHVGNIALGYSISSAVITPSIRYAGRLVTDTLGTMRHEVNLFNGSGVETGPAGATVLARWGDYSSMTVDPVDDCTFWYTNEYYNPSGLSNWRTRIMSFKMPNCAATAPPPTGTPIPGAATVTPTSVPSAPGISYDITGTITLSDAVASQESVGGITTDCTTELPAPFPGERKIAGVVQSRHYDTYNFTNNTDFAQCYSLKLLNLTGTGAIQTAVYLTGFVASDISTNFWADGGAWTTQPEQYSFMIPAHQAFVVKVNQYEQNAPLAYHLKLYVANEVTPTPSPTATATPCPALPAGDHYLTALLTGPQQVPPNNSPATGSATFYLHSNGTIDWRVTYSDLSAPIVASHLHVGPPGANGPVIVPFVVTTNTTSGTIIGSATFPTTYTNQLLSGGVYVNIHTTAHPGGEIRAQLVQSCPAPCNVSFSDVLPANPFYAAIHCLACKGALSGYADGTFKPFNNVTRGQAAKIITIAAGYNDSVAEATQSFTDVPHSDPFWLFVERAKIHGIISGYNTAAVCAPGAVPCFKPNANITRGQIAKVVAVAKGYNDPIPAGQQTFEDVPTSNPFYTEIERVAMHGIISGYTCNTGPAPACQPGNKPYFLWTNNVTRGQTAKIVAGAFYPECVLATN